MDITVKKLSLNSGLSTGSIYKRMKKLKINKTEKGKVFKLTYRQAAKICNLPGNTECEPVIKKMLDRIVCLEEQLEANQTT